METLTPLGHALPRGEERSPGGYGSRTADGKPQRASLEADYLRSRPLSPTRSICYMLAHGRSLRSRGPDASSAVRSPIACATQQLDEVVGQDHLLG
jgi:hypothetical protein